MKNNIYTFILAASMVFAGIEAGAQTWRPKTAGLPASYTPRAVYGEGHSIMVTDAAAAPSTKLYYTPDSIAAFTGSSSYFGLYAALQSDICKAHGNYFMGGIGGVFKSSDNGVTWTATATVPAVYTWAMYACNDTLYANAGNGQDTLSFSVDDGATWTAMPAYTGGLVAHMLKHNGVLYAGGSGGLFFSADNGATWDSVVAPSSLASQSITGLVAFQNAVYACCVVGVFKTTDNGANWTNVTITHMNCMTAVDTSLICGSPTNGIYQSNQSATIWTNISAGLPFSIGTIYATINTITSNSDFVIAGIAGNNGIYVMKLGDLGLQPNPSPDAVTLPGTQQMSCSIMPNPAANEVTIAWEADGTTPATITILDITGRAVKSATVAHGQTLTIAVNDLNTGTYFVQVAQGDKHTVKKMEVIH